LLLFSIAVHGHSVCEPTLFVESGPVYLPGAPLACDGNVCAKLGPHKYFKADSSQCKPWCLVRKDEGPAYHLRVEGKVSDEHCAGIEGATIEVFHTDARGVYNYFVDPQHIGCFGSVKSGKEGKYNFVTWKPGTYGVSAGLLPFDIPPFLPQHIHIAVSLPGYKYLSTQLNFDDDKAREWDWREILGGILHTNDSRIALHEVPTSEKWSDGFPVKVAKFNFVLQKDPTNTPVETQRYHLLCEKFSAKPPGYCHPDAYKFLFAYGLYSALPIVFGIPTVAGLLMLRLLCRCMCGGSKKSVTSKPTSQSPSKSDNKKRKAD